MSTFLYSFQKILNGFIQRELGFRIFDFGDSFTLMLSLCLVYLCRIKHVE